MQQYRYQLKVASAWHVAAELLRRHYSRRKLRVILAHPCGGQVRQLWLMTDQADVTDEPTFFQARLGLSYSDGCAHRLGPASEPGGEGNSIPYIDSLLSSENPSAVLDEIERFARLPSFGSAKLPPSQPAVLVARVIAALARRYVFSRDVFDAECAWCDSSGYGTGIDERLKAFPDIQQDILWEDPRWETQARATCKFWFLGCMDDGWSHVARVLVSLDGRGFPVERPSVRWSLWEQYCSNGRRLRPVVERVAQFLDQ